MEYVAPSRDELQMYPAGSGIVTIGTLLMVVGACGPWIGDQLFGTTRGGLDLGGDGWLVILAAVLSFVPLLFPLPRGRARGFWVISLAFAAGYICLTHYQEADVDGLRVVWGLQTSAAGAAVAALGGIRLLAPSRG